VPDEAHDGYYLLNLQLVPFSGDAAPSRPLIFPVEVS
jgi:arylformamidase